MKPKKQCLGFKLKDAEVMCPKCSCVISATMERCSNCRYTQEEYSKTGFPIKECRNLFPAVPLADFEKLEQELKGERQWWRENVQEQSRKVKELEADLKEAKYLLKEMMPEVKKVQAENKRLIYWIQGCPLPHEKFTLAELKAENKRLKEFLKSADLTVKSRTKEINFLKKKLEGGKNE